VEKKKLVLQSQEMKDLPEKTQGQQREKVTAHRN
jgi:hypothetical protein